MSQQNLSDRMGCVKHFERKLWADLKGSAAADANPAPCGLRPGPGEKDDKACSTFTQTYNPQLDNVKTLLQGILEKVPANEALFPNEASSSDFTKAIDNQSAYVNQLKTRLTLWNENIALLGSAVSVLPAASSTTSPKSFRDLIQGAISDLQNTKVTYVDAAGVTQTVPATKILNDNASEDTAKAFEGSTAQPGKTLDDPKIVAGAAPGIDLQIAMLGLNLMQLEQQRTQRELDVTKQAQQVMDQARAELEVSEALLDSFYVPPVSADTSKTKSTGPPTLLSMLGARLGQLRTGEKTNDCKQYKRPPNVR